MNINIQATEQYNLVEFLTDVIDANDLRTIETRLRDGLAETPYLIFDFTPVRMMGLEASQAMNELNTLLESEQGLLIVSASDDSLADKLEATGVTLIPTVDEAVDYVYMDQLEKEFGGEDL